MQSPEDIERFREEMVKHQPQLAAAVAQKAASLLHGDALPTVNGSGGVSPRDDQLPINGELEHGDGDKTSQKPTVDDRIPESASKEAQSSVALESKADIGLD